MEETKFTALEGLPPEALPVLDLLEGVLSSLGVPGDEPLLFWLLLTMSATAMGQQRWNRRGNGDGGDGLIAIAMGQEQQGQLQGKRNGATVQQQQQWQLQWQWRSYFDRVATVTGQRRSIDCNSDGGVRSTATGQRQWGNRSNCNSKGALGQWQWGNCNGNGATAIDRSTQCVCCVAARNVDNSGR
jgi:hypothetical protein